MITSELQLQIRMLRCVLVASSVQRPKTDDAGELKLGANGQADYHVVPLSYQFHTPCPWGKTRPDQGCINCAHHQQVLLASCPVTEAELDAMIDNEPEKWGLPPKPDGGTA